MIFDRVIIGSSPICLLEALYLKKKGVKVCIIDNGLKLGGAWKTLNSNNQLIKDVEIGCHIIEKDEKIFNFFRVKLKLKLIEIFPEPKFILKDKIISYNFKNFIFIFKNIKSYFFDKQGYTIFKDSVKRFVKELKEIKLKYHTFPRGSVTLVDKLCTEVNLRNIDVMLSTNIVRVNVNSETSLIELITSENESIFTNKLMITNNIKLKEIYFNKKKLRNLYTPVQYDFHHMHFLIKDKGLKPFSYWRIFNNEVIHRVSNMSSQLKLNKDEQLICVGIFQDFIEQKTNEEICNTIRVNLKKIGLISASCQVVNFELNSYFSNYTNTLNLKV
ncbi:MAG: hypothetical protein ACI9EK_002758, partial [Psychroserpens sp.]